ncbi:MAG: trypsin-like peptidase domain-containing protein, partial [Burkholderiales bacterium]
MQKQLFILVMMFTLGLNACDKTSDTSEKLGQTVTSTKAIAKQQLQVPNFAGLVKQVGNTVVNITTETNLANMTNQFGIDPNDPFFDLFKRLIPNQPPQPQLRKAFGSGFIISPDGYILTNLHVVNNAKKIIVRTTQKDEFEAKLIGVDPKTDIALLKVAGKNLPTVKIGDPNKLEVGEWVAAIGAPFGFDNSVTQGIVSGKGRSLQKDSYVPFIQTDVPINPGNSGGPLFNLAGEVVGINSQIYSRSGGYMGISFSIPIDIAMSIANQLKTEGKVAHGQLGVQIQAVTSQLARSFALPKVYGALVANIVPGSGAEKAGIKVGDIILEA